MSQKKHGFILRRGATVRTPDGIGVTIGANMRKNTNGGPGTQQYVVRLEDGRVRHYGTGDVLEVLQEGSRSNPDSNRMQRKQGS